MFKSLREIGKLLRYFNPYFLKYYTNLIFVVILSIFAIFSDLISIGAFVSVIKIILNAENTNSLTFAGFNFSWIQDSNLSNKEIIFYSSGALILVLSVKEWLLFLNELVALKLRLYIDGDVKKSLFQKYLSVDHNTFVNIEKGESVTIIGTLSGYVGHLIFNIVDLIPLVFLLIFHLSVLLFVSWEATIFTILIVCIIILTISWVLRSQKETAQVVADSQIRINDDVLSMLADNIVNSVYRLAPIRENDFHKTVSRNIKYTGELGRLNALTRPIQGMTTTLGLAVVLLALGINAPENDTTWIETLMVFVFVLWRLLSPVAGINNRINRTIQLLPLLNKVKNALDHATEKKINLSGKSIPSLKGSISFRDVAFKYNDDNSPAIKCINLTLQSGKFTALVGKSGSGKSTLSKLLLRALKPSHGSIFLNAQDVTEISMRDWFNRIAYVPQEAILINGTILENIRLGYESVTFEKAEEVSKLVDIHDFIMELPNGYNTYLGEGGIRLSGGQAQRLTIARALAKEADIIIFDEPTSAQDAETEGFLKDTLRKLFKNKTVIMIAHRLSTIQDADQIVVMENGEISELGLHDELLKLDGIYRRFVNNQELKTGNKW
ncbi:ABC transporter ATP-binding protein [Curvivirga aplysinae]|uniref:ABC transporter ATP-binding protein n=1 Tax=Curvivirga aplysinae TaxID=2529852 RepID=UPI0012BD1753|nr:ABC transporter ATP-binding protein [Curvivirga aplysinae]MTI11387.1 ABC transporter ATP-binding protein [Curvivirga aplysinae]